MKLFEKLKESYPIEVQLKNELKNVLMVTILPPFLLLLFQPFGIFTNFNFYALDSWLAVFGFGLVSGVLTFVFWVLLPLLFEDYFEKLNVLSAVLILLLFLVTLSSAIYIYLKALEGDFRFFGREYFMIFARFISIGAFTSTIVILINQTQRLKHNLALSENLNRRLERRHKPGVAFLKTEKEKEMLRLCEETFLFARSSDNYCTIHFLHNGKPIKKLYRLSLKSLVEQSSNLDKIVRCHRSYVINTQKVILTEGNSKGLYLTLNHVDHTIPVSRSYIKEISKMI